MFRLPDRFAWACLDAEDLPRRVKSASAIERANDSANAARIVLFGLAESGKTSLGSAIAKTTSKARDANAMYVDARELDLGPKDRRGDSELVADAVRVPILLIDELGSEAGGDNSAVDEVIQKRHDKSGRQTIVVLHITPKQVGERYSDGIVRRIFRGASIIRCDGPQPTPKSAVERLPLPAPWSPPPLRCAGFVATEGTREEFERVVELVGNGPVWRGPSPGPLRDLDYAEPEQDEESATGTE